MKRYYLFLIFFLLLCGRCYSQCLNSWYGQYPVGTYAPACTGANEAVTTCGYASEYSLVSVVSGTSYTFSSSVGTDYITVSTTAPTALAWGTTPVTWTATFTGTIRFYTHRSSACNRQSVCRTRYVLCGSGGGSGGDDCSSADAIACGDPALVGETSVGNTNDQGSYTCHTDGFGIPIATPGGDHYYSVQWPDAAAGGTIRITFTNVTDANDTYMEVISLGNPCAPPACVNGSQMTVSTGLFGTGDNFIEFTVGPGVASYYFVVDSQNDGIDSYDIQVTCFATGIELDQTNNCAPIPAGEPANQGYYVTWDGVAPPVTADPPTMAAAGPYTICENVYLMNPLGWEWFKYFDIVLGDCWINPTNLTPDAPPNNNGFFDANGEWYASVVPGVGGPDTLRWYFLNSLNSTWGDGNVCCYTCNLYSFCYTADVDSACNAYTGFQNGISATDDGIGGGGGGSVNPSNILITSTSPTVLPVTLVSFNARTVLRDSKYVVLLGWRTTSEINNDYFTIERSIDGYVFEEVHRMPGAGNSSMFNNYFMVDENPYQGLSYYRLKQTDFDGKYEYFDMVPINISTIDDLSVFPNPVVSDLTVTIKSEYAGSDIYLKIYDAHGNVVLHQESNLVKGLNEVSIDMSNFSQGLYFVTIENNGDIQKLKIIKD